MSNKFIKGIGKLGMPSLYKYEDSESFSPVEGEIKIDKQINRLFIDWIDGEIYINQRDNLTIREDINTKDKQYRAFYRVKDDELIIRYVENDTNIGVNHYNKNLFISLPKKLYERIYIDNINANIKIKDQEINELKFDNVNGDITINSNVKTLNINDVGGSIVYYPYLGKYETNLKLHAVSGDLTIYMNEESSFRIKSNFVSGNVSSYLPLDNNQYNNGKSIIQLDVVSGNLKIKKYTKEN